MTQEDILGHAQDAMAREWAQYVKEFTAFEGRSPTKEQAMLWRHGFKIGFASGAVWGVRQSWEKDGEQ